MIRFLIKWAISIVSPPIDHQIILNVPSDSIEYIAWLVGIIRETNIDALGVDDYIETLEVRVNSLEDLFYHIDTSLIYLDPLRDSGDIKYPDTLNRLSLVEFRYNCSRDYTDLSALIEVFNKKCLSIHSTLSNIDEVEVAYYKKRWRLMLSDIVVIYEYLLSRAGVL